VSVYLAEKRLWILHKTSDMLLHKTTHMHMTVICIYEDISSGDVKVSTQILDVDVW
jgi:hypothetical protein